MSINDKPAHLVATISCLDKDSTEVLRIEQDGDVIWKGRKVESDAEFKSAMIDLANALKANMRPTQPAAPAEEVQSFAIEVEKRLCSALGKKWEASGMSIDSLISELSQQYQSVQPVGAQGEPVFMETNPVHKPTCASLNRLLLSNPPKPATCDCGANIAQPVQPAVAVDWGLLRNFWKSKGSFNLDELEAVLRTAITEAPSAEPAPNTFGYVQGNGVASFDFTESMGQTLERFEELPEGSKADYHRSKPQTAPEPPVEDSFTAQAPIERAPLVRLTEHQLEQLGCSYAEDFDFANSIMDAMEQVNRGQNESNNL